LLLLQVSEVLDNLDELSDTVDGLLLIQWLLRLGLDQTELLQLLQNSLQELLWVLSWNSLTTSSSVNRSSWSSESSFSLSSWGFL